MTNYIEASRSRRYGAIALGIVAAFAIGAAALLWAWSTIAVDLFAAPAIGFRHALAAEVAVAVVAGLVVAIARIGGDRSGAVH